MERRGWGGITWGWEEESPMPWPFWSPHIRKPATVVVPDPYCWLNLKRQKYLWIKGGGVGQWHLIVNQNGLKVSCNHTSMERKIIERFQGSDRLGTLGTVSIQGDEGGGALLSSFLLGGCLSLLSRVEWLSAETTGGVSVGLGCLRGAGGPTPGWSDVSP